MKNNDFVLTIDTVFSLNECKNIINDYKNKTEKSESDYLNYYYTEIENTPLMNTVNKKLEPITSQYVNLYPEANLTTNKWSLTQMRFKHFKPKCAFGTWHSENSLTRSSRVLGVQIYLSDHECGTEFYNGDVIKSKVGRVTIFPCYFTHTHRGQVCPDNKDRYILTGYYNYVF